MGKRIRTSGFAIAVPLIAAALPAQAQDISANAGVVSDYRFRGLSQSDRDPALQGGVDVAGDAGWFVGTWASTIADYGGADVEVDVYGGFGGESAGFSYSITAYAYLYPNGNDVNYGEIQGDFGYSVGPAQLTARVAYVPKQDNITDENFYVGGGLLVGIPSTPFTIEARGGLEEGFYDSKLDWELGVTYARGPLTTGIAYVDTNYSGIDQAGRLGGAGVVASLIFTL